MDYDLVYSFTYQTTDNFILPVRPALIYIAKDEARRRVYLLISHIGSLQ